MAQAASHEELREAFEHHLQETQDHVRRLDDIYGELGIPRLEREVRGDGGPDRRGRAADPGPGRPGCEGRGADRRRPAGRALRDRRVRHRARSSPSSSATSRPRSSLDQTLDEESNADKLLNQDRHGRHVRFGHQPARPAAVGAEIIGAPRRGIRPPRAPLARSSSTGHARIAESRRPDSNRGPLHYE